VNGLDLIDIHKTYGDTHALDGVSFRITDGEILAVLGPSGCGKSTLLAIIAGLEKPDRGEVVWNGKSLAETPVHQRGFGLMFQDYLLFPHMNVFENVAFGLHMTGTPKEKTKQRVEEVLELVGLPQFGERDVHTLSGGEQQRVALARALANQPSLLMLDEPLGAVDRTLRERLMVEIRQILNRLNQTALYVTHDQEEAFTLADRVVLMRAGRIEQIGTPKQIYREPANLFVARFLGFDNLLAGQVKRESGRALAVTRIGNLPVPDHYTGMVTVLLRPDAASLGNTGSFHLRGEVSEITFRGGLCSLAVIVQRTRLSFNFPSNIPLPAKGEDVQLSFEPENAFLIFDSANPG
jgi:ABC-type Fe3+/spermidine/putrescine transport system ATPase subunit